MGSGAPTQLPTWCEELLDVSRVAHLGLLDDEGCPRVLPVTFARVGETVWSAVDDKPKRRPGERLARVRWLRARPRSSLTVDRYDDDWRRLAWVQLVGETAVVDAATAPDALAALAERYEQYRRRAPAGPLLALTPARALWWRAQEAARSSPSR
jgi:PPOX class probable F420-dependent enzyme